LYYADNAAIPSHSTAGLQQTLNLVVDIINGLDWSSIPTKRKSW